MGDVTGSHGEDAAHGADDAENDVARDIHCVGDAGDDVGGEEAGGDIDDEGDGQNRGKLEPKVGLEVHRASPILVAGLPLLDSYGMEFLSFPEAELFVHFEEGFEGEAGVAAAEVDRIAAQDPLMGVDDAHTAHNIGMHTLLHGHKPLRNSRR
jgi:hypothetical protein